MKIKWVNYVKYPLPNHIKISHSLLLSVSLFLFWTMWSSAQGLCLALNSEIIPNGAWEMIWDAEDKPESASCCTIVLTPKFLFKKKRSLLLPFLCINSMSVLVFSHVISFTLYLALGLQSAVLRSYSRLWTLWGLGDHISCLGLIPSPQCARLYLPYCLTNSCISFSFTFDNVSLYIPNLVLVYL